MQPKNNTAVFVVIALILGFLVGWVLHSSNSPVATQGGAAAGLATITPTSTTTIGTVSTTGTVALTPVKVPAQLFDIASEFKNATQIKSVAYSPATTSYVTGATGVVSKVSTTPVTVTYTGGATAVAGFSCTGTCTGGDKGVGCSVTGCDSVGSGCTATTCTGSNSGKCSPSCTKSGSGAALMMSTIGNTTGVN